jgi:ketosteroid isomerase-like protein
VSPAESAVVAANAAFYDAINRRDVATLDLLWATEAPVACIHPGWPALLGRDDVMESWRAILTSPEAPRIRCEDPVPHVVGDTAFVVCLETIAQGTLVATNVFVREHGAWKMAHHHAGPTSRRAAQRTPSRDLN